MTIEASVTIRQIAIEITGKLALALSTTVVIALEGPNPGLKAAPFGAIFRGLKPPAPSGNRDLQL